VADTNIYLHHPDPLDQLDWRVLADHEILVHDNIEVVLPILVVDELDDAKRSTNRNVRSRARTTLNSIFTNTWDCPGLWAAWRDLHGSGRGSRKDYAWTLTWARRAARGRRGPGPVGVGW